ncbi:MAG: ATP-dependent zinc metalloprotease FtsH [Deltaproteobacteria bacterium]|nr:ATP-dependent zinc metalloprotease FtsH [Deltaproteobacteria bacterium]
MFYLIYSIVSSSRAEVKEIAFSEFLVAVESEKLQNVDVEIRNESEFLWQEGKVHKKTIGRLTDEVMDKLLANNVKFKLNNEESGAFWQTLLITWLPMFLVFLFLFFLMRQLQSGGGKAMSFGKAKARLVSEGSPKVTFKDVAGADEAKEELSEIIEFLRDPKKFTRLGGRIPKGVLLMGSPGTGKTLLARAIAGEAGVPFFSISGSDFVEMFVGVGASRVRDLFEQSKKHAPCIIFIDEIDAVGRHRGAGLGGGHDEREQTLNQLLVEMDGFESNDGVILIAATNRPDVLDPALLRPGRFDRRVVVPRPDLGGRGEILKVHTKKVPLEENVDLELIARGTPGFSGADLANLVNEAALVAARDNKSKVEQNDFESAKDKVLMGSERKSMIISEKEKLITAYHEAGHTLVAKTVPQADPVHKVTIIPRGRALGLTQQLPIEDRYNLSRSYAADRIAILFGGRIAEDIIFSEITTGAGNDIEVATDLARKMVCEWGMSEKLGPLTFGKKEEAIFLGREIAQHQDYSEHTAVEIDGEVRRIITEQYARAKEIIMSKLEELKRIAEALIEYETLEANEVQDLIDGKKLTREPPKVKMPTREEIEKRYQQEKEKRKESDTKVLAPLAQDPTKA